MSQAMIDYPDTVWTQLQRLDRLTHLAHLVQSKVFRHGMPFTRQSQARWLELILAVSDLVRQASLAGKRISFTEEVSAHNDCQDITSLLDAMRQGAFAVRAITPAQDILTFLSPLFNHVDGTGSGQFANGLLFNCPHANDQAFFIGQNRVYFHRHLLRAYLEASRYLMSLPDLT